MAKLTGRTLLIGGAVALVVILLACGGFAFALPMIARWVDPFEARAFEPVAWATANNEERAGMARGAIRRLPPGTPEADIATLLGPPQEVIETPRLTSSYPRGAVRTHSYYLGSWSGQYYDSTFLWVHVG